MARSGRGDNFRTRRAQPARVRRIRAAALASLRGSLKRSARAVQLFGRLAVLETHTLRYQGPLGASW